MFLALLLAAQLRSMANTISTFLSDNFKLTRGRVNYEGKGKKTREEFRFTSVPPVPLGQCSV